MEHIINKKEINIIMITYFFPPSYAGGTIQALELAKGLRKYHINSIFIGANIYNAKPYEIYEGFEVFRIKSTPNSRISYLNYALQICWILFRERTKFQLVLMHSRKPFWFIIVFFSKILRKPILTTLTLIGNDDPISLLQKSFLWRVEARTMKYVDKIICKSSAIKKRCLKAGIPDYKLHKIPNGTNTKVFFPVHTHWSLMLRKSLCLSEDQFIVVFIGSVSPRKGCDILFDAWDEVQRNNPKSQLLVIGPYETILNDYNNLEWAEKLQSLVNNEMENRILFLGHVPHSKVALYLQAADCFVLPSKSEGLPNALLEAMATGLPVITSNIPGVTTDIVQNMHDGIILKSNNFNYLALEIERVIRDRELRYKLSQNALEKISRYYSIDIIAKKHADLYYTFIKK